MGVNGCETQKMEQKVLQKLNAWRKEKSVHVCESDSKRVGELCLLEWQQYEATWWLWDKHMFKMLQKNKSCLIYLYELHYVNKQYRKKTFWIVLCWMSNTVIVTSKEITS